MDLGLSDEEKTKFQIQDSNKATQILEKDMQIKHSWYTPASQYIGGAALVVVINIVIIALSSQNYDQLLPWNIGGSDLGNWIIWILAILWMGLVLYALFKAFMLRKDAFKSKRELDNDLRSLIIEWDSGNREVRLNF